MEKLEVYPYRREGRAGTGDQRVKLKKGGKRKEAAPAEPAKGNAVRTSLAKTLHIQHVLLLGAGFFLGRAVLLGELLPFGVAFVAASLWVYGRGGMAALVGVLAGLITVASGVQLSSGVVAVVAVGLAVQAIPAGIKKQWLVVPGLALAVLTVTKTGFLAFGDPPPYVYISIIFEAVFAGALTLVLLYGLPSLGKLNSGKSLGGEEIFCIVIILVAIIAGAGQLEVGQVSLKGVLSRVVVLVAALAGGPGLGAAAGAVVGIIPGLAYSVTPAVVGAYSFAGLLAGLFRNLGKPGVLVGFLLGNIILSVYVASYGDLAGVVAETALAGVLFLVLPATVLNRWRKAVFNGGQADTGSESDETIARDAVAQRMRRWSGVFRQLAGTFQQAAGSVERAGGEDGLQSLFNQIGDKVCTGCALYRTCWERDFYNTYQKMLDLFAVAEAHGRVTPDDIGDDIRRRCNRIKELAITVTCLYELHKLNRYWSRRISESRGIVYEQLRGVSEIINNLSQELEQNRKYDDEKAFQLRQKFRESELPVADLLIINSDQGGAEIEITLPASPDIDADIRIISDFVSDYMGCRYAPAATNYPWGDEDFYTFYLYPGLNYCLELGLARRAKGDNNVSGDSYSFLSLPGGKLALFLSDGMGAGPGAAAESSAAISLLQYLLESGFDRDLALKTLNSLLMLNSQEDCFATLDMVVVCLYSGRVEFVKIGAPPSFLVREGRVRLIRADSLPVGIISDIEVFAVTREMSPGDMLVIVTDGIFDTYQGGSNKEDWISNVLQEVVSLPPQDVADLILKLACTGTGQQVKPVDDMTVLVARIAVN